jgi:hypothetical protein
MLSIEISLIDFGHADTLQESNIFIAPRTNSIAPIVKFKITDSFSLYAMSGIHFWRYTLHNGGFNDKGNDLFFGVGAAIKLGTSTEFSIKKITYTFDDKDINNTGFAFKFNF